MVTSKRTGDGKCYFDPHKLNQSFVSNNNSSVNTCFQFYDVDENDILKVVKTMKSNACGVDEVSAFFYQTKY